MHNLTAFQNHNRLASGTLADVVAVLLDTPEAMPFLVFDDRTGRPVDLDLRGTLPEIVARHFAAATPEPRGRGRPKLGVTAREVTLLPRHWDWLAGQPGGASAALRRLVEVARKTSEPRDQLRRSQDAAYQVMHALAGDYPGYEEALRALFAGDLAGLSAQVAGWPDDIRTYVLRLAGGEARGD